MSGPGEPKLIETLHGLGYRWIALETDAEPAERVTMSRGRAQ